MRVKKFEARSMNDALEMVKRELGPDAIILSARDNRKKFGLVGDGSVEITAAVAEQTLQKKKFAESKMKPDTREKFLSSSARQQRQIVNNFADNYHAETGAKSQSALGAAVHAATAASRPTSTRRYIDIEDENVESEMASERIKDAAQRAWEALREAGPAPRTQSSGGMEMLRPTPFFQRKTKMPTPQPQAELRQAAPAAPPTSSNEMKALVQSETEIHSLRNELESLKSVLRDFQKVPQNFASASHPGSEYGLTYDFSPIFEKLILAGLTRDLAGEILQTAQKELPAIKHKSRGLIDGFAAKMILETTKVVTAGPKSRIHVFVGPRGAGKTSALVKMASHAVVSGKSKVALLTTDNHKVGSVDQMRIFSQILNVPFGVVKKASDWKPLLEQLKGYDLILCDFPGLSLKNIEEISLLKSLMPSEACETHLVLSALSKDAELDETCRRFDAVKFNDIIFNHLDEALAHGSIYNIMRKFDRPLHSFGVGPNVPEDFEAATKERVLDLIFRLTKFRRSGNE